MYICICNPITEKEIVAAINSGSNTLELLKSELGVASCCGKCEDGVCQIIDETNGNIDPFSLTPANNRKE